MHEYRWKNLNNYVLLDINTSGNKLLEICCIKVKQNEIYKIYYHNGSIEDDLKNFLKFIGRSNIVGWCVDFDIEHLEAEYGIEFQNNFVDVFQQYYKYFRDRVPVCSLRNVYKAQYRETSKLKDYNFDNVIDKCKATKQLYDSEKHLHHLQYVEWRNIGKK